MHHARAADPRERAADRRRQHGVVIVNPDKSVLAEYQLRQGELELERAEAQAAARPTPATTLDGRRSSCTPTSSCRTTSRRRSRTAPPASACSAREFLFLNRDDLPSEDEQFEAYRRWPQEWRASRSRSAPSTSAPTSTRRGSTDCARVAPNPALGLRAIRFCLAEPQMFLTQLRAILRASHYGKVRILIPMLVVGHRDRPDAGDDRAGQAEPARAGRAVRCRSRRSAA